MSVKDMLRAAFGAKDQKAFDALLTTMDEESGSGSQITVHNHMPEGLGGANEDRRSKDDEPPPWFKKHSEETDARFKAMHDALEGALQKWAAEEEDEPNHNEDRRSDDRRSRDGRSRDRRTVHDRLNSLHDAVSSMLDWARDMEEKIESKMGGEDRRGEDGEQEEFNKGNAEGESEGKDRRGKDEREDEVEKQRDKRSDDKRGDKRSDDEEILGELEFEAPPGTGDRARRATDSAILRDSFQDALARAEVLAPGIRLPTFDRAAKPAKTLKDLHGLRCSALDLAWSKPATRGLLESAIGGNGRTLDTKKMPIGAVRSTFNAVAAAVADANNNRARDGSFTMPGAHQPVTGRVRSLADLNKVNAEHFHPRRA